MIDPCNLFTSHWLPREASCQLPVRSAALLFISISGESPAPGVVCHYVRRRRVAKRSSGRVCCELSFELGQLNILELHCTTFLNFTAQLLNCDGSGQNLRARHPHHPNQPQRPQHVLSMTHGRVSQPHCVSTPTFGCVGHQCGSRPGTSCQLLPRLPPDAGHLLTHSTALACVCEDNSSENSDHSIKTIQHAAVIRGYEGAKPTVRTSHCLASTTVHVLPTAVTWSTLPSGQLLARQASTNLNNITHLQLHSSR